MSNQDNKVLLTATQKRTLVDNAYDNVLKTLDSLPPTDLKSEEAYNAVIRGIRVLKEVLNLPVED